MRLTNELELVEQVFQGCFERGEYSKALATVQQCENLSYRLFQSDHCTADAFIKYHDKWEYYKDMGKAIKNLIRQESRARNPGFFGRLFGSG